MTKPPLSVIIRDFYQFLNFFAVLRGLEEFLKIIETITGQSPGLERRCRRSLEFTPLSRRDFRLVGGKK